MGEKDKIEAFWTHYARDGQAFRLACREWLLEQCWPVERSEEVSDLRPATRDDISLVLPAQAEMAVTECGVNPLEIDPMGFRGRCLRRIERGRVWVTVRDERLAFKADIMAETPEMIYLEGVYVDRRERGRGYGRRCLLQLGRILLSRSRSICLLVNELNAEAKAFYLSAGYRFRSHYETIYLHK
jgi:predicted GNAT family acetyltransferase